MLETRDRHRRQKLLSWLGEAGQERLARSSVLITRVGGLGGPLAQGLVLAGVGRIVFFHEGELLNEDLHRMVLMDPGGVGRPRAPQAEASLRRLAADAEVRGIARRLTAPDAAAWMSECDLAVGAAPTYEERLVLNDAAVAAGKPYVDAAMCGDEAHLFCVRPGETACLRCLIPMPPPWDPDFPVLGAVSAMIGSLAAAVCVRILAGADGVPWGEFVHVDLERFAMRRAPVERRPACAACGSVPGGGR